eukprot:CAMPEP_0181185414 /NCGR_PEP_ID=MMETSP1096-20121128/9491_1 /TAXON_ID=156174 ORGANISM="Chrysochromulina ericina, Strain CCMP281" /NCGR_SAMPLE_ID=MMETSP1096 /ASSEMBLY_ACC=CAM_ASM_000453 /LENGTH=126 /DNA_ID=CAMNT_0023274249 /DNA_START=20 /DNA_END=400 /DNA_ORIENTATION=-
MADDLNLQLLELAKELEVERTAHDETAEQLVDAQERLEVTVQELANLERFTKDQHVQPDEGPLELQLARLLKEEAYLKSRLAYVQQEIKVLDPARGAASAASTEGDSTAAADRGVNRRKASGELAI